MFQSGKFLGVHLYWGGYVEIQNDNFCLLLGDSQTNIGRSAKCAEVGCLLLYELVCMCETDMHAHWQSPKHLPHKFKVLLVHHIMLLVAWHSWWQHWTGVLPNTTCLNLKVKIAVSNTAGEVGVESHGDVDDALWYSVWAESTLEAIPVDVITYRLSQNREGLINLLDV